MRGMRSPASASETVDCETLCDASGALHRVVKLKVADYRYWQCETLDGFALG